MKNLWLKLLKPAGTHAKWLTFAMLLAIIGLGLSGKLEAARVYLDTEALTFKIGAFQITAYGALRAFITLVLIFWLTAIASDFIEGRLHGLKKMKSATKALLSKVVQIVLYIVAGLVALDILGIDLTTLTVFGGAVGIGLGFGLQKIASNFVSGLILLFEGSVEKDDLIELPDGTFGFVRKASARYTLVETLDTKEILIPNEDFITNRVINWTLTSKRGRVEILIGVSYKSNIKKAHELILEAAREHPRCTDDPEPVCYLRGFGDSSVNFVLWFWVDDITLGRMGPISDIQFAIWDKFAEHGIEIPFPQRDLHIKSSETLKVQTDG